MANVPFLGTTDEVSTCDCCGKTNLKSTLALSVDGGEAVYYGVVCAARAIGRSEKEVRSGARAADKAKAKAAAEAERKAHYEAFVAQRARWQAWLQANGTGRDDYEREASLGGYATAWRAFLSADRAAA